MSEIPPAFKSLTTYIKRAEELDNNTANADSPVVAYFCRRYALNKGLKLGLPQSDNTFLYALMENLEKSNSRTTTAEGKPICENFATHVFELADAEDRGPQGSTMGTARSFYACSAFFDILEEFGELDSYVSDTHLCLLYVDVSNLSLLCFVSFKKNDVIQSGRQQIL
jgi:hypothetical protein